MNIYINAGHHLKDSGGVYETLKERNLVIKIRDLLKQKLDAYYIDDSLTLRQTIAEINLNALPDDLALGIHFNKNRNSNVRGVEAYYSKDDTLAEIFARNVALATGLPNRGVKHDSEMSVGSSGFLRKLKCKSVILEICYLSNPEDRKFLSSSVGKSKIVQGILNAYKEIGVYQKINIIDDKERRNRLECQIRNLIKLIWELKARLSFYTQGK